MRVRAALFVVCVVAGTLSFAAGAAATDRGDLQMYRATVSRATVGELVRQGFDVTAERDVAGGVQIDMVLSAADKQRLAGRGVQLGLWRNRDGKTATQLAAAQAAG